MPFQETHSADMIKERDPHKLEAKTRMRNEPGALEAHVHVTWMHIGMGGVNTV